MTPKPERGLIRPGKIFKNFGFLTTGKLIGDGATFVLFVVLSRVFGQEGIGWYSFAIAFTGFFVVSADFGLLPYTIKELSRSAETGDRYGQIWSLRLLLSLAALVGLLLSLRFLPLTHESKIIVAVIGLYQLLQKLVEGHAAVFIARENTRVAGLLEGSFKFTAALVAIIAVAAGATLWLALTSLPVIAIGQLLLIHVLLGKSYDWPRLVTSVSSLIRLAREAIPYALSMFLFQLYSRIDVVLVTFFLGAAAAGLYNVAYRIVFTLFVFPLLAATALFPQSSRLYKTAPAEFERLYHKSLNTVILFGLPASAGLWLIAPSLINLVFGADFAESALVLRILAGLVFLTFLNRVMGAFLMSSDRQREWASSQWIAAAVNVAGNLLLIPAIGIAGAAISTLLSEILLVVIFAVRLRPVLGWPRVASRFLIGSVGAASFCIPFTLIPRASLGVVIPASVVFYCSTLLVFREIRENEIPDLLRVLRGES